MSITARQMVMTRGPAINPKKPKTLSPPKMPKKSNRVCTWVLPLMRMGRRKLSERLTTIVHQHKRITALR
jgi:hypothetical protein